MLAEAKTLWDFHRINDELARPADAVVAMGCKEPAVAQKAAKLYLERKALFVVCTGANSSLSADLPTTEAEYLRDQVLSYRDKAFSYGVPERRIVIEPNATNTKENIGNVLALPNLKNFHYRRIIWVHFPEMGLRVQQTLIKQSAGRNITHLVTHPEELTFTGSKWQINLLMGNTDRLVKYGQINDLEKVEIPDSVQEAYCCLKSLGFGQPVPDNPHDFHWRPMDLD